MQAGDQVAFELVGERRLVAQIIKPADPHQRAAAASLAASKREKASQTGKRKLQVMAGHQPSHKCVRQDAFQEDAEVRTYVLHISFAS